MTKLIINADDFGYSKGVNLGILEAFQNGIVTSSTMMTNMPAVEHAATIAKQNPELGIGIHFVLTCGAPLSSGVPTLINENGDFKKLNDFLKSAPDLVEIEKEFRTQIQKFLSLGLTPTHFDSHHHVHSHPAVFSIVEKLALEHNVPIRNVEVYAKNSLRNKMIRMPDLMDDRFYGDGLNLEILREIFQNAKNYQTVEIMTHPAYIDQTLLNGTSYALPRVKELEILTSSVVKKMADDLKIEFINFNDI
ncbi:MAG: hypothetical protein K0R18_2604 [Bacillales bacterium]|jgi:predicted glycoside hydrolase/deacetylase ChbG (UPF0249 family)|nr:hypothetical protein [Bacillales bacterium]